MNLNQYKKFHFVGIGGVGMRALTYILLQRGYMVTGSDQEDDAVFAKFRNHGAVIYLGHDASHVDGADVVVVSTAIRPNNPEVVAAKEKGIPVMHRSDVLAAILNDGCGIAVAGAHGKTTTTSMLGQVFEEAGVDPTIVIGGEVDYLKGNSKAGKGPHVIAEADESDGSFLKLQPAFAVVTNIEDDHLDYYGSMERLEAAFVEFIHSLDEKQG
ncbi:MAG: Mur ligase domain-containing protein, partial [Negativicoccus succinicivorans]|nr:Mur ligase domain-containing protein [Negativicoccus succinicivorans]